MGHLLEGFFRPREQAEQALSQLVAAGYDRRSIGIVMRDREEADALAHAQGLYSTAGAVTGSVIGGGAGTLLAATGTLVVPGIGPFIAGGILATALARGAVGWLAGGLIGLGIPHERADYYHKLVEEGWTLLTVDAGDRLGEARDILRQNGAHEDSDQGGDPEPHPGKVTAAPLENPPETTDEVDRRELLTGTQEGELRGDAVTQGDAFAPELHTRVGSNAVTDAPPDVFPDDDLRQRTRLCEKADEAMRDVEHAPGGGPEDPEDIESHQPLL
jgi:hypothetical protein